MNKKILLAFIVLVPLSQAYFINPEIDGIANKYKGYDEILLNITRTEYRGESYYWVDYSKNLAYSSSVLLDGRGAPVSDKQKIFFFALAKIINQNYPRQGIENWMIFSENYERISAYLPADLSSDAKELSKLFKESAGYMEKSIEFFSPDDAEKYFTTNKKIIDLMSESNDRASRGDRSQLVNEYVNSLNILRPQLIEERKNVAQGADYLAETASLRVLEEKSRQKTEETIIAFTFLIGLITAVLIILKKRNII